MDKDKIRQMAAVKAHMDWPPETDIWYAAYYAFIAGYEACDGKESSDEPQTSNCIKNAVSFSMVTCGDCGWKMTIVRPGKYQCDNPDCFRNH